jgi:hypothetical protein
MPSSSSTSEKETRVSAVCDSLLVLFKKDTCIVQVRLEGLSKYVVNWVMSAGDLVLDRSREVLTNIRTVYIIDEVSI